ncbi:MAG: Gfo/Idh/MocA family oxidoreductase [Clostridiales bacterium]|nr:Gfo/Idh/MocA family oxidoreductase [Clostridiales bacterium]
MQNRRLRVTIVGTGQNVGISRAHLMGYRYCPDDAEVSGIFDVNMAAAQAWKKEYDLSNAVCYGSFEQALENSDVVSICTPNDTHVGMICRCLEHDVNVLCEKPLSNTMDELERIAALLKTTKAKGMINLNYRRIPAMRYLSRFAAEGGFGKIYLYRHTMGGSRFANEALPMEWRLRKSQSGSGAIGDFCSHMLDMVNFILGDRGEGITNLSTLKETFIKERKGRTGPEAVENEDAAVLIGTLPGGGLLSFMTSRVGAIGNRLEIIGSKAIARFNMEEPARVYLQKRQTGGAFQPEEAVEVPTDNPDWHTSVPAAFVACAENVREFVHAIRENAPVPTDLAQGMRIQRDIEQILAADRR